MTPPPKIAIFAGSFDPITLGHTEIALRGLKVFDKIVVALGINSQKKYLFSLEQRLEMLQKTFENEPNIEIISYEELTVSLAKKMGANYILRGLRSAADLEYEQPIALINSHLAPEIETVCLLSNPHTGHISSTIVRELIKYGGNLEGLVPKAVMEVIGRNKA
ncbi:MAG: pantetheine-phosphate adenylyltransferase [Bacteroidia bacterium]